MKTFKDKNILKAKTKIKISNKFQLTIFFFNYQDCLKRFCLKENKDIVNRKQQDCLWVKENYWYTPVRDKK